MKVFKGYAPGLGKWIITCPKNNPKTFINWEHLTYNGKPMQHVKITKKELKNIGKLYESVMSNACHGLFFREGAAYGAEIAAKAMENKEMFWEIAEKELKERGWVEEITFDDDTITVMGSIEASKGEEPSCHRLRGILRHLFETHRNEKLFVVEQSCEGQGNDSCVFAIEPID